MPAVATSYAGAGLGAGSAIRTRALLLPAGSGRKLTMVVANSSDSTASIDSATFDGVPMSTIYNRTLSNFTRERWFELTIPDGLSGTLNFAVTLSADSAGATCAGWVTTGDSGASRYATNLTGGGTAAAPVSIAVSATEVILLCSLRYGSTDASWSSSEVSIAGASEVGSSNSRLEVAHAVADANETITATATYSSSTGDKWTTAVVTSTIGVGGSNAPRSRVNGALFSPLLNGGLVR